MRHVCHARPSESDASNIPAQSVDGGQKAVRKRSLRREEKVKGITVAWFGAAGTAPKPISRMQITARFSSLMRLRGVRGSLGYSRGIA